MQAGKIEILNNSCMAEADGRKPVMLVWCQHILKANALKIPSSDFISKWEEGLAASGGSCLDHCLGPEAFEGRGEASEAPPEVPGPEHKPLLAFPL